MLVMESMHCASYAKLGGEGRLPDFEILVESAHSRHASQLGDTWFIGLIHGLVVVSGPWPKTRQHALSSSQIALPVSSNGPADPGLFRQKSEGR